MFLLLLFRGNWDNDLLEALKIEHNHKFAMPGGAMDSSETSVANLTHKGIRDCRSIVIF